MVKIFHRGLRDKKIWILWMTIFTTILMFGLMIPSFAADEIVVKFGSSDNPPFWSETLPQDGMCGEILHAISGEIDVKSVIEYLPMARVYDKYAGNAVGNPEFFLPYHEYAAIIPIAFYRSAIFYYKPHHQKEIIFNRLADLRGYVIGVQKGTITDKSYFDRAGIRFEESYSQESLFRKLTLGRIDLCIEIDLSGRLAIKRLFPKEVHNFGRVEISGSASPITIMIEKNFPKGEKLGRKYKEGLRKIVGNGKYREILEKYYDKGNIPRDWSKLLDRFGNMYYIE
ncbi:MAG: transporter substrate-binding domain-containing protein [Deltaproteobacteria bacterium]|nr:transporter substrate-binding domain-containing protein [Deltaproteobacteria bacterium]